MDDELSNKEIIDALQKNPLFRSLSTSQLNELVPFFRIQQYDAQQVIVYENEMPIDLYVIWEGAVEVLKKSTDNQDIPISTLAAGEVIGEVGLLDNSPRSATVRTITPTKVLAISIADLESFAHDSLIHKQIILKLSELIRDLQLNQSNQPIYYTLVSNLSHTLSQRIRQTNQVAVESLKNELKLTQARVAMGKFMINILFLISAYIYAFKIIEYYTVSNISSSVISIPIILFYGAAIIINMKRSGYPMAFYGLTLNNWRPSIRDGLIVSVILVGLIVALKWSVIHLFSQFNHLSLVHFSFNVVSIPHRELEQHVDLPMLIMLVFGYLIFTPLQELICRGALQGPLEEFLVGPHRVWWAILMSNILFSITHLHISVNLALVVIVPGLLWGWMYSKNKTLIGVAISHLIVGGLAFFVFDIKSILIF